MIGSLVRLLGLGDTPRATNVPRFAPQLEVLDGRTMPSVVVGGVAVDGGAALSGVETHGGAGAVSPQDQFSLNGQKAGEALPSPLLKATPILF